MNYNSLEELSHSLKENKEQIQNVLKQIKPLSRYSDECIPLEKIEEFIRVMSKRYEIEPQWINFIEVEGAESKYSLSLRRTDDFEWAGTVYGRTLYELMSKIAVLMYAKIKFEKVKRKD